MHTQFGDQVTGVFSASVTIITGDSGVNALPINAACVDRASAVVVTVNFVYTTRGDIAIICGAGFAVVTICRRENTLTAFEIASPIIGAGIVVHAHFGGMLTRPGDAFVHGALVTIRAIHGGELASTGLWLALINRARITIITEDDRA